MFNKATLIFENGKKLVIEAPQNSKENIYVQSIKLNNRLLTRNYIMHSELQKGGKLHFMMGSEPAKARGIAEKAFPYSMSTED